MWFLTVFGLMWSSAAMTALSLPFAMSFSTSISRSESSARIELLDLRVRARGADPLQHLRGDVRGDQRLAACRRPDARDELLDRGVLEEIAAGAREDRVGDVAVLVGDREHHDARQRRDLRDVARRLDAAHRRHVEIHDDDVRRELADVRDGLAPVAASPTISSPCSSSRFRRPVRNRSWSSTSSTRSGSDCALLGRLDQLRHRESPLRGASVRF